MSRQPQLLFYGSRIIDEANNITQEVVNELSRASIEALRRRPADDIIQEYYNRNGITLPFLKRDQAEHDRFEGYYAIYLQDARLLDMRKNQDLRQGVIFSLEVPFVGDAQYFRKRPNRMDMKVPLAAISGQTLTLYVPAGNLNTAQIQTTFDAMLDNIDDYLARLAESLQNWPMNFRSAVAGAIASRLLTLGRAEEIWEGLTFKPKRRPNAPEIIVPLARKQIRPAPIDPALPLEQQLILAEDSYKHILSILHNMSRVIEFSPKAFANLGEEAIRFHFLVQLNGQYEGTATGETFNGLGKSDIIVRQNTANVFVAECKIWEGPQALSDAVDQLQNYITWRDTKTALIIFNRNKNFSGVVQKAQEVVSAHPLYKSGPIKEGETQFRYIFKNASDESREYILTLMLFNIFTPD
jgi:hypothetical protein